MRTYGYEVPGVTQSPQGDAAVRKYALAKQFVQNIGRRD